MSKVMGKCKSKAGTVFLVITKHRFFTFKFTKLNYIEKNLCKNRVKQDNVYDQIKGSNLTRFVFIDPYRFKIAKGHFLYIDRMYIRQLIFYGRKHHLNIAYV